MLNGNKILAALGTVAVTFLPILAETTYAQRPAVHLMLIGVASVLSSLGFALAKPLFSKTIPIDIQEDVAAGQGVIVTPYPPAVPAPLPPVQK